MLNEEKQIDLIMYSRISAHISDWISILIKHPEDIRYRLPKAWGHSMYLVKDKFLPPELKKVWNNAVKKNEE